MDPAIAAPLHLDIEYDLVQHLDTKAPGAPLLDLPMYVDNEYILVRQLGTKTPETPKLFGTFRHSVLPKHSESLQFSSTE